MNQFCERSCVESKLFFRHRGYQLGARLVIRLVEHVLPRLPAELLSVGGRQERALMMIEPPCHLRRTGILEIDDDILIAVEDENRSEEHTSELQSRGHLVCRLLLEKKKNIKQIMIYIN